MSLEEKTELAFKLRKLGVSGEGVYQLLSQYPIEVIDLQLSYLPFRKARRPEAFIVEAIRKNYSPPSSFYAKAQTDSSRTNNAVDETTEHSRGSLDGST